MCDTKGLVKYMKTRVTIIISLIITALVYMAIGLNGFHYVKKIINRNNMSMQVNIKKGTIDTRDYRYTVLSNGLRVVVVSDPDTDKSAAAMRVFSGSYDEPDDVAGVAHFLEHMLFLGNKKYPDGDYFKQFLSQHGGSTNAYTALDETVYFFNVLNDSLADALDIFAQFFISPLFNEDMLSREKHAVDAEYRMHLKNDAWRQYHVNKATANPQHPFSRFTIGNLDTLSSTDENSLRSKVIDFYKTFYSSKNMVLTIYGKQPIEQLIKIAEHKFTAIPEFAIPEKTYTGTNIWRNEDNGKLIRMQSSKNAYKMSVSFLIPNQHKTYKEQNGEYIVELINRSDANSLKAYLLEHNLIDNLYASIENITDEQAILSLDLYLTSTGFLEYEEVLIQTFAYFNEIKKNGVHDWLYQEIATINEIELDHADKSTPIETVRQLTESLHMIAPIDLITSRYLLLEYNEKRIREILALITPSNMRAIISSKDYQAQNVEEFFQVPYDEEKISHTLAKELAKAENHTFSIRGPNQYISNPQLIQDTNSEVKITTTPTKLVNTDAQKLWCLQDNIFALPRITIINFIRYEDNSLTKFLNGKIYAALATEFLHQKYADAIDAHHHIEVIPSHDGISIEVEGYDFTVTAKLIKDIYATISEYHPSENRFVAMKALLQRSQENLLVSFPGSHLLGEARLEHNKHKWTVAEQITAMPAVNYQTMQLFSGKVFSNITSEIIVYGNADCHRLPLEQIKELFPNAHYAYPASSGYTCPLVDIPKGYKQKNIESKHTDHGVVSILFSDSSELVNQAKTLLLSTIVSEPFFDELRTEKQLGYFVQSSHYIISDIVGMFFVVQSPHTNVKDIKQAIDAFIDNTKMYLLAELSNEEFLQYKNTLLELLLKKPTNREEVITSIAKEIKNRRYSFAQRNLLAERVEQITKEELFDFYKSLVGDSQRRVDYTSSKI